MSNPNAPDTNALIVRQTKKDIRRGKIISPDTENPKLWIIDKKARATFYPKTIKRYKEIIKRLTDKYNGEPDLKVSLEI